MTTIADSIKGTLDAGWTAAGGAEPTYYVSEDYTTTNPPPAGKDYIWVNSTSHRTKSEAKNDTFSNITHTIEVIANTLTSADRRKEIADEIVRILDSTAITGVQWQKCTGREVIRPEKLRGAQTEKIVVTMIELLASSTSAYGANTAASYLNELLMYGSANAAWVPCIFELGSNNALSVDDATDTIANTAGTDINLRYVLPEPTVKGTLKLYITGCRVVIGSANATNYLDALGVYGTTHAGKTAILPDDTNRTAQGTYTTSHAAIDCSGYTNILVYLIDVVADAWAFHVASVSLLCYYAA